MLVMKIVWQQFFLQIWELRFGHKAKLLFRLRAHGLLKILKLKLRQDFEGGIKALFCRSLVKVKEDCSWSRF